MGRHNNKGKYKKKREQRGLRVDVRHNNIEGALKIFKRKTKDSGILLELKKRSYFKKPSEEKREKKAAQKARYRYQNKKDKSLY